MTRRRSIRRLRLAVESLEDRTAPAADFGFVAGMSNARGISVATDDLGNVYECGLFVDTSHFGPGPANVELDSAGGADCYLLKYSAHGTLLWAKSFGGSDSDVAVDVTIDGSGNLYVTGYFLSPTMTVGATVLTQAGGGDGFVAKFGADGAVIWAERFGGGDLDIAGRTAVDSSGNVYLAGVFQSATIVVGATTLTNASAGKYDSFVAKLNGNGNVAWAARFGGTGADQSFGIATDAASNVYITGSFTSPAITFGMRTLKNANPGFSDIYVAKLDGNSGGSIWASGFGSDDSDEGASIATDSFGGVYVAGDYSNATAFGATTLPSNGGTNGFVAKLDSTNGAVTWADGFTNTGNGGLVLCFDLAVDPDGNAYVTGSFGILTYLSVSFHGTVLTSAGDQDIFDIKLDRSGNVLWAERFGGPGNDNGEAVALDQFGSICSTGYIEGATDFRSTTLTSGGSYLLRLKEPGWLQYTAPTGNGPDRLTVRLNGDMLEVYDNRTRTVVARRLLDTTTRVAITGAANEADSLTLDYGYGGFFALSDGISFDAGASAGDSVIVKGLDADQLLSDADLIISKDGNRLVDLRLSGVDQAVLYGGNGDNKLNASGFASRVDLYGLGGNDTLVGGPGNDRLFGGAGDDQLTGDLGNDLINGGPGSDTLLESGDAYYKLTNRTLTGLGRDVLSSIERAILFGGDGDNLLDATAFTGPVELYGGDGNDTIKGGKGDDLLDGGAGNDQVYGNGGSDFVYGGDGNDTVSGGNGSDFVFGGLGADVFAKKDSPAELQDLSIDEGDKTA